MNILDMQLYCYLPSARNLTHKVSKYIEASRLLVINMPEYGAGATKGLIKQGLADAHYEETYHLEIQSGMDLASEIGPLLKKKTLQPSELAAFVTGPRVAVVLHPADKKAHTKCEGYAQEFWTQIDRSSGNVCLIVMMHNDGIDKDMFKKEIKVINFDGGLTEDEMQAYVAIRMIDRPGPGSTNLYRSIVSEFSGFDPLFAEKLIAFDDARILSVQKSLPYLFSDDSVRYSKKSWLQGTKSRNSTTNHVMYDYFMSISGGGEDKDEGARSIDRRYWKACVRSLLPWMEERRLFVINHLLNQLKEISKHEPSRKIPVPRGSNFTYVAPSDIEYNNIVGLFYNNKIKATSTIEEDAINVCKIAKKVRDDIAHLRAPDPTTIDNLIALMDKCRCNSPEN